MIHLSLFSRLVLLVCFSLFFTLPLSAIEPTTPAVAGVVQKQPKIGFLKKIAIKAAQKRILKLMSNGVIQADSISPCAKIELINGKIMDVELAQLDNRQVSYRACGGTSGDLQISQLSAVKAILARNGDVLYGKPSDHIKQVTEVRKTIPLDSTGRCAHIVFKDGRVEKVDLATWEAWGLSYRLCDVPDGELKSARFEETASVYARNGDVLYASNAVNKVRVSDFGPLLLVLLGAIGGIFGILLILLGIYLSAKRLKTLKKNPNAKVGNPKTLKAALILGVIFCIAYAFVVFPLLFVI